MSGLLIRIVGNRGRSPGPSDYSIKSKMGDAPKYTIKNRYKSKVPVDNRGYGDPSSTLGGPRISIHGRHESPRAPSTPGPDYVPPHFGEGSRKSMISPRHGTTRDPFRDNPGPGEYSIPEKFAKEANKFTMKGRHGTKTRERSPGPAAYTPDWKVTKVRAPSVSVHVRPQSKALEVTPGPSDYTISRDIMDGKKPTIHGRTTARQMAVTPGPSDYTPKVNAVQKQAPIYSIKDRYPEKIKAIDAPYLALPTTMGEGPKIALSSRHKTPEAPATPGPNYVPPSLGQDAVKNTISGRRSDDRNPFRDNPGQYTISPTFAVDADSRCSSNRAEH